MQEENQEGLTISPERVGSFLELLGFEETEDGHIVSRKTGETLKSADGDEITVDEIGYLGSEEEGLALIKDDISHITRYLSDNQEYEVEYVYETSSLEEQEINNLTEDKE